MGENLMSKILKNKTSLTLFITFILITGIFIPMVQSKGTYYITGFDKGPSYKPVAPMKKITFVNFDTESYVDDYAYLAAVPTAVFNEGEKLISHPLLFYQDEIKENEMKYQSLNAYKGIKYFMEDWMSYCNNELDQMTLINVDKNNVEQWKSREYTSIKSGNPYEIAKELALKDWSYSKKAVLAVIDDEFKESDIKISNKTSGTLPASEINHLPSFQVEQTNSLEPVTYDFHVDDKYVYMNAEAWWDGVLVAGIMIPTGDPDIQLYYKYEDRWAQAAARSAWNIFYPKGHEITQCYVYQPGDWKVGITDFPTEGDAPRKGIPGLFEIQGSLFKLFKPKVTYHVDITMYPGVKIELPDNPPFGCRNATFKLTWDNPNVKLGFTLVGPGNEAIFTEVCDDESDNVEMKIKQLGELLPGEHYSISVFTIDNTYQPVNFEIEYNWEQEISEVQADALTSATEGAVLASSINSPLLYVKPDTLPQETKEALYKLGVENIYLINIGGHLSKETRNQINNIAKISEEYTKLDAIYKKIRSISNTNTIVFTTIAPWTYWYAGELKPAEETKAGYYIGPSAYVAAHHGTPVIIVDNHPRLSSAVVWPNEFWRRFSSERAKHIPSTAEMYLTGTRIYDFLKHYGFDKEGEETILTVAGQYEIGLPWDRIFVGVANPGRICGTPVDTSTWISRSMFYPALIFENPALNGPIKLINGSKSERKGIRGLFQKPFLNTLVVKDGGLQEYNYPVLCSFVTHKYRFNERASKYYGTVYQCADGYIPGETKTMSPIDQGVNQKYYGEPGATFPDITESEVVPFYLNRGGFDTVFSTKLESVAQNLNSGVILWVHTSHGYHEDYGRTLFWDPQEGFSKHKIAGIFAGAKHEENPWRGYDWELGSTEEPDTMSLDIKGAIPFTNHVSLLLPATGMDWLLSRKPIREMINKILFPRNSDIPFDVDNLYDGLTGTIAFSKYPLVAKNATQIEALLENLHSAGFITSICQTSNTYLHLMLVRHGSVFQVQDPWPTSWYGAIWRQSIPRDIILGKTVGQTYSQGISHVGSLYLGGGKDGGPQWWWDDAENVVYFGDPNIRMYVPDTKYSSENHWEKKDTTPIAYDTELSIDGHTPFGAMSHPNEKQPVTFLDEYYLVILALIAVLILLIIMFAIIKKK